jgi:FKBP-type peptidyl-prolyl cis-trans isomerase FklB
MKAVYWLGCAAALVAATSHAKDVVELNNEKQKFSYAVGIQVGQNLKRQNLDYDATALSQGIQDALAGTTPKLSDAQMRAAMEAVQKKELEKREAAAKKNLAAGHAFLAENKKKAGVVTRESGLQYKVVKDGKGKQPKATDTVQVHYRGTLLNGTEFDSSYQRGEPATFPVNGVIQGWQEVLPLMREGAKWQVWIPSDLAYGARGAGGAIGPNETLVFEIELLAVK